MRANTRALATEIASERISVLFGLAKKYALTDSARSKRYIRRMKEISTHFRIKLPKEVKNGVCKRCGAVLFPGVNAKVRIASSKRYVSWECLGCKTVKHVHY